MVAHGLGHGHDPAAHSTFAGARSDRRVGGRDRGSALLAGRGDVVSCA